MSLGRGCSVVDEVGQGVLHGVEVSRELAPHYLLHLALPLRALGHRVLYRAIHPLVARCGVLHVGGGAAGAVLSEVRPLCLELVDGLLHFLEVALHALQSLLHVAGNLSEVLDINAEGKESLRFLHEVEGGELALSAALGILGLLGEGLSLLDEVRELLGDDLLHGVNVGSEILEHLCTRSQLSLIEADEVGSTPLHTEAVDLSLATDHLTMYLR